MSYEKEADIKRIIFFSALSEDTCRVTSTSTKTLYEDTNIYL